MRPGRHLSHKWVRHVLEEEPIPLRPVRRFASRRAEGPLGLALASLPEFSPKFALLATKPGQRYLVINTAIEGCARHVFVLAWGPRDTRRKVEAKNPALRNTGTRQGPGSQWCDRLPSIPRYTRGEGVVVGVRFSPPT